MGYVTRFAPSPTGRLHLGHAYSALCAYGAAVRARGRFLVRIEDIDLTLSEELNLVAQAAANNLRHGLFEARGEDAE